MNSELRDEPRITKHETQVMLKIFLWLRYLRKKRIVFLSIAAVALSAALLIVVSSLFIGFINAFEHSAVDTLGDVVIEPPMKITNYPLFIEQLERASVVEAASATLWGQGLLYLGKGNVRAVSVLGIEPGRQAKATGFKHFLHKQKSAAKEVTFEVAGFAEKIGGFVGIGLAAEPDEKTDEYDYQAVEQMIGREVILTTGAVSEGGQNDSTTARVKKKLMKFTVTDIVFTGVYELDKSFVYLPIDQLQKTLYPGESSPIAGRIQIRLASGVQIDAALAQIRGLWQGFAEEHLGWGPYLIQETEIKTAIQMQSRYIAEIRKQMGVLLLIFGVVSASVVVLVFCIFYMIVETCRRDIAIIKSCGATSGSVTSIFIGFGGCVGIVGAGVGMILGIIVTKNINTIEEWIRIVFGLKLWKSSVYIFSRIPSEVDWNSALPIALSAVLAAALGALIPAIVAAKTKPVEILRYE